VFHRGPLSAEEQALVDRLRKAGRADAPDGQLFVAATDLDGEVGEEAAAVWKTQKGPPALPWIVLGYPEIYGMPWEAWSGPLTAESVAALVDSPARRELARRIVGGDSGVFLLLEGGDRAKDDAAEALLRAEFKRLQGVLQLPGPVDGSWDDPVYDTQGAPPLKITFSVLRVARDHPAESVFVSMLLGTEADLRASAEPIVFAFYGRARILYALVGKGINRENVEALCDFLVGPCSCIVKEQNPGIDTLTVFDWEAALMDQASAIRPVEPPPLAGLAGFGSAPAAGGDADAPSSGPLGPALAGVGAGLAGAVVIAVASLVVWKRWQRRDT
jgi:hypothetical protein